MKYIDDFDFRIFDSLIQSNTSFAVFRLPKSEEIRLILQETGSNTTYQRFEDINRKGFVIAPFRIDDSFPVVLINPEITLDGLQNIFDYLTYKINNTEIAYNPNEDTETSRDVYESAYNTFHSKLKDNTFQKIVLSKIKKYPRSGDFSAGLSFSKACRAYPDSYIYLCHTPISGTWLGATPELLLSKESEQWKTVALAGTRKVSEENIDWDDKNISEQKIVSEYIEDVLQKANCKIQKNDRVTVRVGNLEHLKTEFIFEQTNINSIGNLLQLLHPTPAVCGLPKNETYNFIVRNEGHNRKYYSGFIGEIQDGGAQLYVNLRCMNILSENVFLYAGSGLLTSSEAKLEWDETEMKLQAMSSIIA